MNKKRELSFWKAPELPYLTYTTTDRTPQELAASSEFM